MYGTPGIEADRSERDWLTRVEQAHLRSLPCFPAQPHLAAVVPDAIRLLRRSYTSQRYRLRSKILPIGQARLTWRSTMLGRACSSVSQSCLMDAYLITLPCDTTSHATLTWLGVARTHYRLVFSLHFSPPRENRVLLSHHELSDVASSL